MSPLNLFSWLESLSATNPRCQTSLWACLLLSWPSPNASRACRQTRLLPFWWTASLARRVYLRPPSFSSFFFISPSFFLSLFLILPHFSSHPLSPFSIVILSFSLFDSLVRFLNRFSSRFWLFARIVLYGRHRLCWYPRDLKTVRCLPSSCVLQQP